MTEAIRIATRKSPLALAQTEMVHTWLEKALPEQAFENLELSTQVDERLNWSLEKRGGIGLFTKELEEALLDGRAKLAIHSAKDMPTTCPDGLEVAGYLPRAAVEDVLVYRDNCPAPRSIATSSPRRRAQLSKLYPDAEWTTIRGNVGTRLRKISEGECDASLLAAAGLNRLEIFSYEGLSFNRLSVEEMVPAPGQAAIAIQCRTEDLPIYKDLFCASTKRAVTLEKSFLKRLGSGCQIPVGAYYEPGRFRIFHPDCGYRSFDVRLEDLAEVDPVLDSILDELAIGPAN